MKGKGDKGWVLKQVHVVIRHGDRTPLNFNLYKRKNVNPDFCNIYTNNKFDKNGTLLKYGKTMSAQYSSVSLDSKAGKKSSLLMHPLPLSPICLSGRLTNLGVFQHLHNGFLLREIYVRQHKLLESDDFNKVKVFSTQMERTFRSAVAFLYGLIQNYHVAMVPFIYAYDVAFCGNNCHCPAAKALNKAVNARRHSLYWDRQSNNVTIRRLDEIFSLGDHTGTLMDLLVTGYLCKGMPLPCDKSSGYCITPQDLDTIMDEQEHMNKVLYEESPWRNQSMLIMQPLLIKITQAMTKVLINSQDADRLSLYSGHDTTLRPLLHALGIQDHRWPRLASRLVFELWESRGDYFIKILFNGKDVTSEVAFCPDVTCPFSKFQHFANHGIPEHFGVTMRKQACKVHD